MFLEQLVRDQCGPVSGVGEESLVEDTEENAPHTPDAGHCAVSTRCSIIAPKPRHKSRSKRELNLLFVVHDQPILLNKFTST